jgi:hypothetical protein
LIENDGKVDKAAWECALLTAVRDEIKSGNISIGMSKSFGRLDDFFMPEEKWLNMLENFFARAGLPSTPNDVREYLTGDSVKLMIVFLRSFRRTPIHALKKMVGIFPSIPPNNSGRIQRTSQNFEIMVG